MKTSIITLLTVLAASVAASPVHPGIYDLEARGANKAADGTVNNQGTGNNKDDANKAADGTANNQGTGDKKDGGKKAADGTAGNGQATGDNKQGTGGNQKEGGNKDKNNNNGANNNGNAKTGGGATTGGGAKTGGGATTGGGAGAGAGTNGTLVLPDGRIAQNIQPEGFNVLESVFKSAVVKGEGLKFSDVITFPNVKASIFDKAGNTKAFAIDIDDKSIFTPQGGQPQSNIRRADLLPSIRSQLNDVAVTGVRTLHFSVQRDAQKPLNETHDYQLVSLESKDFTKHQFDVRTGADNGKNIAVVGTSAGAGGAQKKIFQTPFGEGAFENFAIKLDFDKNTMQVFHSTGDAALKQVTEPIANDLSGLGEYHFALQKNAVGTNPQPAGIKEAIIYGGIFMEDSTSGTVSLQ
ncbi:hypothetical protein MAPG_10458 [Magnaporthiopsis poae ATCC 64411]|uniref:Glycoside hydrolase 131 catalytic N-terminal domain-containing protein n=1 Tax=Magnaporthiopsis poae (strain ATCC 64411 / 73-15) TaxID=644358 RepID=A0A0C4ECM7_MAGP6|nr:hypothetical protein MAPG_10458 [Magnaporthiopsis poae ATCC 64411]